jgi:hypothetical protein
MDKNKRHVTRRLTVVFASSGVEILNIYRRENIFRPELVEENKTLSYSFALSEYFSLFRHN